MGLIWNLAIGIVKDPVILPLAGSLGVLHVVLTVAIGAVPVEGPWKQTKIFSAKQIIALVLMITQTILGLHYWFSNPEYAAPYSVLVTDESNLYGDGVFMAQVVLGGLLYDIPAGFATGAVDTLMHMHHFGMFTIASIAMGFWSSKGLVPQYHRYTPFFFGVIEFSSIFLQIVELFHPRKQPEWYNYHNNSPKLQKLNEICRILFAVTYIIFRMIWFPKVIIQQVWPDSYAKWNLPDNAPYTKPIVVVVLFTFFFTGLQLYWGSLILQQIAKMLKGDNSSNDDSDAHAKKKK